MRIHPSRSHAVRYTLAALLALGAGTALAQMQVDCFAEVDCRGIVARALDTNIPAKFPANRYKVVVFASKHEYSNGGGAAFAVVGLSEKASVNGIDLTVLPLKRFSASQPWSTTLDKAGQTEAMADALRFAIEQMNQRCNSDADCPVFVAYR